MADWIELKKKRYLTVEDMTGFNNNFNFLRDYYLSFDLPVGALIDITVSYNTTPADIQQIFNNVEHNIQTLEKFVNEYLHINNKYFKRHTWQKCPKDRKKEVWRWIDWFNELKKHSIAYIDLTDANGEVITDINGETLQVLKVYKEEN